MTLKIEHVTKKFGDFMAVNDLSMTVEKGSMYGFLGANGAGKTTIFRMILGLLDATEGAITWDGKPITYASSKHIGYLPEERGLYPKMKVADQLVYLGQLRGMKKNEAKFAASKWLERFEVLHYAHKKVEELSKGNQQKIQVIASIIHKPSLIILDEPFSGLDPINVEMLKKAILDIQKEGATIVFSSHRMDHVEELCEQLCILHHGEALVSGTLSEVKRGFGLQNVRFKADFDLSYLGELEGVSSFKPSKEGGLFQISEERTAHELLRAALVKGNIRYFAIEEPSLQDIFIQKVGKDHA